MTLSHTFTKVWFLENVHTHIQSKLLTVYRKLQVKCTSVSLDPEFKDGSKHGPETYNRPEVLDLLKEFRAVLDAKTKEDTYNPR